MIAIFTTKHLTHKRIRNLFLVLGAGLLLLLSSGPVGVSAQQEPRRTKVITVSYMEHEWLMLHWSDNSVACKIHIDHEGQPAPIEIFYHCGGDIYREWLNTSPCQNPSQSQCSGYYLHHTASVQREKKVTVELPKPEVTLELADCPPDENNRVCSEIPNLVLKASEPLPNEKILRVQGTLGNNTFLCQEPSCEIPLYLTSENGVTLTFWADSSYGDSSPHYRGKVRVVKGILPEAENQEGFHVSLLSKQYKDNTSLACAKIWHAFPPLGAPPDWLANPQVDGQLATDEPLTYLAGRLIAYHHVDASACDDNGLLGNGFASPCGLQEARTAVTTWQNSFDPYILKASYAAGIPSQLLKRIFIQESQLWPGTKEGEYEEFGLGHMTELGAETTLLWNNDFYNEFCPLVLHSVTCQFGYPNLKDYQRAQLRGALLRRTSADHYSLFFNKDFEQYQESIDVFAKSVVGHCQQIEQIIYNNTGEKGGEVATYEDLWRYTLVDYHAGSGCIGNAIEETIDKELPLSWNYVASALNENCPSAIDYIEALTK